MLQQTNHSFKLIGIAVAASCLAAFLLIGYYQSVKVSEISFTSSPVDKLNEDVSFPVGSSNNSLIAIPYHCGIVTEGRSVRISLPIDNQDTKALKFMEAKTTCGCLAIKELPSTIAPSQQAPIALTLNTAAKHGNIHQTAILTAKNSRRKTYKIDVTAGIRSQWAEPDTLNFGAVQSGASVRRVVNAFMLGYPEESFTKVESTNPNFLADMEGRIAQRQLGEGYVPEQYQRIVVQVSCDAAIGMQSGTLRVMPSDTSKKPIEVSLAAEIVGLIRCLPGQLVLNLQKNPNNNARKVKLATINEEFFDFNKIELECELPGVTASIELIEQSIASLAVVLDCDTINQIKASQDGAIVGKVKEQIVFRLPILLVFN